MKITVGELKGLIREVANGKKRIKLSCVPPLNDVDRKALSAYVQMLKVHRPHYVEPGATFTYRGSLVTVS